MRFYPFYSAAAHLYDFEGLDLKPDEFEIYGYRALELIGNYWGETVTECIKIKNFVISLPDDCDYIEQITRTTEDFQITDNIQRENYAKQIVENYVESRKRSKPILYQKGGYINYEINGDQINFKEDNIPVLIMYRRRALDSDGHPLITRDETEAIAAYCVYINNKKKLNLTKDKAAAELMQLYKSLWDTKCSLARTHEYFNQNDADELANINYSYGRKTYNLSKKTIL